MDYVNIFLLMIIAPMIIASWVTVVIMIYIAVDMIRKIK